MQRQPVAFRKPCRFRMESGVMVNVRGSRWPGSGPTNPPASGGVAGSDSDQTVNSLKLPPRRSTPAGLSLLKISIRAVF